MLTTKNGIRTPVNVLNCNKNIQQVYLTKKLDKALILSSLAFLLAVFGCSDSDGSSSNPNIADGDLDEISSSSVEMGDENGSSAASSSSAKAEGKSSAGAASSSSAKAEGKSSADAASSSSADDGKQTFKDARDGKTYKMVQIDSQTWMAENLNYETADSYCYEDEKSNCEKYGRLYTWEASQTVCPTGWHLPNDADFKTLIDAVGGEEIAGTKLKSTSGWKDYESFSAINGTDDFGFSALPAGTRAEGVPQATTGVMTGFWTSVGEGLDNGKAYTLGLFSYEEKSFLESVSKNQPFSIRCLKDSDPLTDARDGQTYKTIQIGDQVWMAQNLNYETADSYCYEDEKSNCEKYGRLYTWEASQTACPTGWHLPNKAEFTTLIEAVGGKAVACTKLRSNSGWAENSNGTDDYGISALPAGWRNDLGDFSSAGTNTDFWTSTEIDENDAFRLYLDINFSNTELYDQDKDYAISVRCLKD